MIFWTVKGHNSVDFSCAAGKCTGTTGLRGKDFPFLGPREPFIMPWLSRSLHFMKVFSDSQDRFFYVPG